MPDLRCWKREGHKDQTFLEVVENSCNPGFVEIGQRLGAEKVKQIYQGTSVLENRQDQELQANQKEFFFPKRTLVLSNKRQPHLVKEFQ